MRRSVFFALVIAVSTILVVKRVCFLHVLRSSSRRLKITGRRSSHHMQKNISPVTNSQCVKKNPADSYIVCSGVLPLTKTVCGRPNKGNGPSYVVPNVIHYIWFGNPEFRYYHYLSVRSAAANQKPDLIIFHVNDSKPVGEHWDRLEKEVPCLSIEKMEAPTSIYGQTVSDVLHQTDIARLHILLRFGGIYLDTDNIVLRSLDPLRKYPTTIGRSTEYSLSNGAILAEPNAEFLREWLQLYSSYDEKRVKGTRYADYSTKVPFRLHVMRPELRLHVEDTSMQRPNPWSDGRSSISHGSYDISSNYILHLHPQKSLKRDPNVLLHYRDNDLRKYDSTYGAGARAALFGTQDLVFVEAEKSEFRNRTMPNPIILFKPVKEYSFSSYFPD